MLTRHKRIKQLSVHPQWMHVATNCFRFNYISIKFKPLSQRVDLIRLVILLCWTAFCFLRIKSIIFVHLFSINVALRKWRQFCITRWARFQILCANASKSEEARAQKTFNLFKSACDPWERHGQPLGLGWRRCWSSKNWTLILWEKREWIFTFMWNKCNLCVYVGLVSSPVSQTRSVTSTRQQSRTLPCRWNLS